MRLQIFKFYQIEKIEFQILALGFKIFCLGGGSLMAGGPNYPSMRSAAGPSSSQSASGAMNSVSNGLMAELLASANNLNNGASLPCGMAGSSCGAAGLTSSSLFNVLQQEVAEETRLAALNAMTQRLMSSLEGIVNI